MRNLYLSFSIVVSALLTCSAANAQIFPVDTIMNHGSYNNRINVVYVAEGYTSGQTAQFAIDANNLNNYLFSVSPFVEYAPFFNAYGIRSVSVESGAKHPVTAPDCPPGSPVLNPNNYFSSTFDAGNIHRLLVPGNYGLLNSVLQTNFPLYDQACLMVNSTIYGGSGGTYATTSLHPLAPEIMVHEIGHSFAGLSDEYWYAGSNCSPGNGQGKNVSQVTDTSILVWRKWLTPGIPIPTPNGTNCSSIGLYQGANYCANNWYRPKCNCKMQTLGIAFCEVCRQEIIESVYQRVNPITGNTPASGEIILCSTATQTFTASVVQPTTNTIKTKWILNGNTVSTGTLSYTFSAGVSNLAFNTLTFSAKDTTPMVKDPLPEFTVSWTIVIIKNTLITANGPTTFCQGGSLELKAYSSGNTYQWYKNGFGILGATNRTYTVTSTGSYQCVAANTCGSTKSNVIKVTVNPLPTATMNPPGPIYICAGQTVWLYTTDDNNYSYQWYKDSNPIASATNYKYGATQQGNYYCKVTSNLTSCTAVSPSVDVFIVCREEEQLTALLIKPFIYPNPAIREVHVGLTGFSGESAQITFVNVMGERVIAKDIFLTSGKTEEAIDISALPAGYYWIHLEAGSESFWEKLVIGR